MTRSDRLAGKVAIVTGTDPVFRETVFAKKMIRRLGRPEDVAWLATFLASDESGWITGADHHVDGGATAW